jgi:hypothetical protein
LINCLLPLAHSPWAFIQTRLNRLLFLYNYFQMTSRLQNLLSLSLTHVGLYLNLIHSTTRTPCLDLLGSGSYLILISSPTRIHMISLLNRTCISLMLPCVYISYLKQRRSPQLTRPSYPSFLPECLSEPYPSVLPDRVALTRPYPISLLGRITPYRLCPGTFYTN